MMQYALSLSTLAAFSGSLLLGCGGGNESSGPANVKSIMMEQGGACVGTELCWWRTTVTAPGVIRLESKREAVENPLPKDDFQALVGIVSTSSFQKAIGAGKPVCPVTFDNDIILSVETAFGKQEDKFASGCIINDEQVRQHPYRDLFKKLDSIRRAQFPEFLPF